MIAAPPRVPWSSGIDLFALKFPNSFQGISLQPLSLFMGLDPSRIPDRPYVCYATLWLAPFVLLSLSRIEKLFFQWWECLLYLHVLYLRAMTESSRFYFLTFEGQPTSLEDAYPSKAASLWLMKALVFTTIDWKMSKFVWEVGD